MHLGAPSTEKVRNVVLCRPRRCGEESLAEAMLFISGATKRLGTVDDGHSTLDYEAEEISRQFTINLRSLPFFTTAWKINVIDTPATRTSIGMAIAGMEAAEMALFVVDAVAVLRSRPSASEDCRRDGNRACHLHQPRRQRARRLRRRRSPP